MERIRGGSLDPLEGFFCCCRVTLIQALEPGEVLPREHPVFKAGPRPPPSAPAPDDKRDTHLVYVLLSVNIVEAVLSSYFFLMVVFLSHVIPGRIGITFWHQLALLLLQAVPSSIGLGRLSILVWPFLIRVVATAVFLLVSLAANVCTEVKRREAFSTWLAVTVLEQCKQNVTDIEVKAQITYATDLISDSLELLTRCPNIYASHVDEKLREQTGRISAALRSGTLISMLELDLQTERRALIEVGYALLKPLVDEWSCEDLVLRNFLWRTDQHYQDTPYHNQIHGAMVAFMMARMINALQVFSESQILALTATRLASLCHDVGHPGRNNAFLTSTSHLASIIYNDSSILENFHAALTFRILSSEDSNIVENTAPEFYRSVRALMIDLILATDMKSHFDFVTRVRTRRKSPEFNVLQNIEDQCLMSEACMRAADIGHGLVNWEEHYEWSMRVTVEFYLQGDEEKRLGLPTSPLCDRDQASQLPKSQVGFLTYVVLPLIVELQPADESNAFISSLLANLTSNATKWESLQGKEVEKPASFSRFDQRLRGHDMQLDVTLLTRKEVP
ncbi:3'5'-cyclic nucleotide phosphodiesterase domain-containing protein [Besnoitia besnoiti]|uniref:Phosphodiesterase n=1 Tax=Besnoitia besnoiti TaxID=94643 RepID=A0A2A9M1P3_BESBE|nr:3'5'-cyclic nucleotide phosphodiesterase domain-containing protein [Besnoitia besnoiti]PFH32418.1 3'5'-cyclic nucleotide phosphodiesterase domain-containing protein [Besnoitia besnoiti]